MSERNLSGTWQGFYEQDGARHGISMRVVQKGLSLMGAMQDADTILMGQLKGEHVGMLDGAQPEVITTLPSESVIEGEVTGRRVLFVKRYRGSQSTTVWMKDQSVSLQVEGHRVWYGGTLDAAAAVLAGEWSIPPMDGRSPGCRGHFELRRQ